MRVLPAQGKIGFRFGQLYPPSFGDLAGKPHLGTDIFCPVGTPIVAPTEGIIIGLRNGAAGGLTVQMRGDDGWYYRMLHNSEFKVVVGQRVRAGELVALSGNTGVSTAPHCHADRSSALNSPNIADYSDLEKWIREGAGTVTQDNARAVIFRIYKYWLKNDNPLPADIEAHAAFMVNYLNTGNEADADRQFADFAAGAPSGSSWAVIKEKLINFINSL